MRKTTLLFITLITFSTLLFGFSNETSTNQYHPEKVMEAEGDKENKTSLEKGTTIVLATINELHNVVERSPENTKKINTFGKVLDENWDLIEKKVEKKYPEDYKNIEESLYPLIGEAQKEKPDLTKLTQLIKETSAKLLTFKDKVSE
ncbi:hypothetical protein [Aquibacillus rhizosphaerae]|uniref:Uncharacterized protein n=1 Tax=Aquibacillus rhizosphaerae TaxID=3051431 RepID=A0ABT7LB28_9BACI|nr:hypothetical protein [Aquibacillus sp. LR5S19]MDL4843073.1 hypothetical protein [Aquibacillus sp. LR5S19]